ncbi:MAG: alpha/beta hydrolase [Nevskia sp.]|nr:alpha/beta hydrolase [Nevskia sp.]
MRAESVDGEDAAYAAARAERIDTGDAVLAVRRFGSGPPLLLVHGFPLHGYTWRRVLPGLAQRYTCHVVDLAGLGDSEWSEATDWSWEGHARRLQRLADHLGLQRYGVLAQDTGGSFARFLALADHRVDRLVLINTEIPGHRPPWIPLYQWLVRNTPGAAPVFRLLLRSRWFLRSPMGFGGCFVDLRLIEGGFHRQFVARYVESARATEGMVKYLGGLRWDSVDALRQRHAQLRMPVLLLWGEDDPTFPTAHARDMVGQIPDCRLVAVAGARLLVQEERPEQVVRAVLDFLGGSRPERAGLAELRSA